MIKKILKAGVSAMVAICMTVGLSGIISKSVPVQAAGERTNWTYSTVGIEDGTHRYNAPDATTITERVALGNSKFSGYVKFSSACGSAMLTQNVGMANLCFGIDSGNDIWTSRYVKFALVTANGETYLAGGVDGNNQWIFRDQVIQAGEEILLQVAFDYIDKDGDTKADDLQIKVWINGVQATQVQQGYGNWDMLASSDDVCVMDYVQENNPVTAYVMLHGGQDAAGTVTGNVTVRSIHKLTVSGMEDGKAYCSEIEARVATSAADGLLAKDLAQVTVGGSPITLTDGNFTIPAGTGQTTVVVTDKAGVAQTYNITVNDGHVWGTTYVSNEDATCKEDGTKSLQCTACMTLDTANKVKDEGSKLSHVFENYVPDNDATCVANGHETARCKFGCGETDTREIKDTATGKHTYGSDNKCTVCKADNPDNNQAGNAANSTPSNLAGGVQTGDYTMIWSVLALVIVSAVAVAFSKKKQILE